VCLNTEIQDDSDIERFIEAEIMKSASRSAPITEEEPTDRPYSGLIFALLMMFDAVDTRREQVESQIRTLAACAQSQRFLNDRIASIEYVRFPSSVDGTPPTNEDIQRINAENARLNIIRSNLESQVMTVRQGAQIEMTNTQASISTQQIYISQASNAMYVQTTVARKINQMNEKYANA
jgi:hypothetical protein